MAAWLAAHAVGTARAQSVEQFYKGRTITLLVSSAPGGVSDIASRLVARHLHRFIPGEPTIVVQNLPGQSGVILVNRLYNASPKTGEVIAFIERGPPQLAILGNPNVKFDPLRFTWLGSLSSYRDDAYLLTIMARSPVMSVSDLKTRGMSIHLGAMTPGTTNFTFAYIAKNVLGLNISIVRGYSGAAPIFLAMQAGETDGQVIGLAAIRAGQPALWNNGELRPLIQFARTTRHPELPDIPVGRDLAPDDNARALIEFAELPFFMALPFAAPPDVPADRAKALRDAFMQMTQDADFIADAAKLSIELSPVDGAAIHKLLKRAASSPQTVIDDYNRLLTK